MHTPRGCQRRSSWQEAAVGNSRCILVKVVLFLFINSKSLLILFTRNIVMKHSKFINEKPLNLAWTWEIWGQGEMISKYLKVKVLGENWSAASGEGRFQLSAGNFCQVALRQSPQWLRSGAGWTSPWPGLSQGTRGWAGCSVRSFPALGEVTVRSYTKWRKKKRRRRSHTKWVCSFCEIEKNQLP